MRESRKRLVQERKSTLSYFTCGSLRVSTQASSAFADDSLLTLDGSLLVELVRRTVDSVRAY